MSTTSTATRPSKNLTRSCARPSSSDFRILIWAASAGSLSASRPPTPARSWVWVEQRLQVEHDVAVGGGDDVAAALDHSDEGPMGTPVGLLPAVLGARRAEQPGGAALGHLPQPARGGPGEGRGPRRQRLLDLRPSRRRSRTARRPGRARSAPRIASFSSSSLLVSVQLSVSSSCRFAQTAKTARKAISDATTMRTSGRVRRRLVSALMRQPKPPPTARAMARAGVCPTGVPPRR